MRNLSKFLLIWMMVLLSSIGTMAQLQVNSNSHAAKAPSATRAVLYEQMMNLGAGSASQNFETSFDAYDCQGADDFYVPTGTMWTINTITAPGTTSQTSPISTLVNVFIYADAGGVPASSPSNSLLSLTDVNNAGVLTIQIPGGLQLGPGHWWISIQYEGPLGTYGQWFWTGTTTLSNSLARWINPGGGFGYGTSWITLATLGSTNQDFGFRLEGSAAPLIPCTYTISLYDAYGDGWNGGYLDVLVNNVVVLNDITLVSGSGPANYYFPCYNR